MPERFISCHFLLCLLIPVWKDLVRVGVETEGAKDAAQNTVTLLGDSDINALSCIGDMARFFRIFRLTNLKHTVKPDF